MPQKWDAVAAENLVRNSDSGIYYLRAKVAGRVVRRSLKTDKLRVAKLKRDDMLSDLRSAPHSRGAVTVASLTRRAAAYYATLPHYQAKPRSGEYRDYMLGILDATLPPHPEKWTPAGLRDWWAGNGVVKYSPGVRNNLLGTLRRMIALMIEAGEVSGDPSASLHRVAMPREEVVVPSKAEFVAVVAEMRSQPRAEESANLVEWMAYTGIRIGEARAMLWGDVGDDEIQVTGGDAGTKNNRTRRVPVTPAMRALLGSMTRGQSRDKVFHVLSPKTALNRACKSVGCERMTPHTCRHYFATGCIESGVDIPTVASWLGHQDRGVLAMRTYGHLRNAHSLRVAATVVL